MAAPLYSVSQMPYKNPHSTSPLYLTVICVANTSDEDLARNIKVNSALDLPWLAMQKEHKGIAVMVGGGPSAGDFLKDINNLALNGATVFAMNGASQWLRSKGIAVDYQVIADAKPDTGSLVDPDAYNHLFASQVHPNTMAQVDYPTVWHLAIGDIEPLFPEARRKRGGYALIGGGAAVGNSALCVAYALGYRTFEIYGFDSCHRGDASHAYEQPMNFGIPCVEVPWAGKTYYASVAMKAQAERFMITGRHLKEAGCTLNIHGDGLLPAMWNTPFEDLSEQDKYRLMWQFDMYRGYSPGEEIVETFLEVAKPEGLVIDFGCGTGRAGLKISGAGHEVILVDFADNCRDQEAITLPFIEHDLTKPFADLKGDCGICTDVMEHIPTHDAHVVIGNIMNCVPKCLFQISTVEDKCGMMIGKSLHLTVRDADWWRRMFETLGYAVTWQKSEEMAAQFLVTRNRAQ
jgi:hypothetical protein